MRIQPLTSEIRQLYRLVRGPFTILIAQGMTSSLTRQAEKLPLMFWPDGSPCWEANMYLMDLVERELAIGTVKTHAANLSPFLRFTFDHRLAFLDLRDNHICQYSLDLQTEAHMLNPAAKRRGGDQTNKLIRAALELLIFVQSLFKLERKLVGDADSGAEIVIEYRQGVRKGYKFTYLWHRAMTTGEPAKEVRPIGGGLMQKLLDTCPASVSAKWRDSKDLFDRIRWSYIVNRRRCMIKSMWDFGARRKEVGNIKVADLEAARNEVGLDGRNVIELFVAKRGGDRVGHRKVPVPRATLTWLSNYVRSVRAPYVARLIKRGVIESDPGWLFLNEKGERLDYETMTQDMALLRRIAGIRERATLHMFRHRWITLEVMTRYRQFIGKKMPAELAMTILTEVASLTGHKSIDSLWTYVDFAFDEMGVWKEAEDALRLRREVEAALRELREIQMDRGRLKCMTAADKARILDVRDRVAGILADLTDYIKPENVDRLLEGVAP